MTTAPLIADYILAKSDRLLTPMELIKLAYISYGFTLALSGEKLFKNKVEAWRYGPVIPKIYQDFKHYGGGEITELGYCGTSLQNGKKINKRMKTIKKQINPEHVEIIDEVLEKYGHFSGLVLSTITHENGTPWDQCYKTGRLGVEIPDGITKDYYEEQLV